MGTRMMRWMVVCAAVAMVAATPAWAARLNWIRGEEPAGPWRLWTEDGPIGPEDQATPFDTVHFSGPLNGVYGNGCYAEMTAGGSATLRIDPAAREVEVAYVPPAPDACICLWDPVCGLEGEFGPLLPGEWHLVSNNRISTVSKTFTVRPRPGDANGDGRVDLDDFAMLKRRFGLDIAAGDANTTDFDNDGDVDLDDFVILKRNFHGGVVPEPATLVLMAAGAWAVGRRKR
ncbi:MAG: dockerin type I domain-containing protein [Planctomycetota bacterium]